MRLADLAGESWTTGYPGGGWEQVVQRTCRQLGGFEPDIRHRTNDSVISLELVAAGQAVMLLPELVGAEGHPGVAVRAIAEGPLERTIFAATRSADAERPSLRTLLAAIRAAGAGPGLEGLALGQRPLHVGGQRGCAYGPPPRNSSSTRRRLCSSLSWLILTLQTKRSMGSRRPTVPGRQPRSHLRVEGHGRRPRGARSGPPGG